MSYFIVIRGPMGSGKTTIAGRLAKELKGEYVSVDEVLDKHHLTGEHEGGYISQKSFIWANEIVSPGAAKVLQQGRSVIFDGNFYWKSQVDDLIDRLDSPYFVFTLKVPLDVCVERDIGRAKPLGYDAVEAVFRKVSEFDYGESIDASVDLEKVIQDLLSRLPNKN